MLSSVRLRRGYGETPEGSGTAGVWGSGEGLEHVQQMSRLGTHAANLPLPPADAEHFKPSQVVRLWRLVAINQRPAKP